MNAKKEETGERTSFELDIAVALNHLFLSPARPGRPAKGMLACKELMDGTAKGEEKSLMIRDMRITRR